MRLYRRASALVAAMISRGSIELPRLLLIFRPLSSRTVPWMYTSRKGISPMNSQPAMIMRATQKKIISEAVTSVWVG